MSRFIPALAGTLLLAASTARAADGPSGTWKMSIPGSNLTFLFTLEEKNGKWTGRSLGTSIPNAPKVTMGDLAVTADSLRVTLRFQGIELNFDGKLPPDAKTGQVAGSLQVGPSRMILVHLVPSKLKEFDKYEYNRETVEQATDPQVLTEAAVDLLKQAGEKKAKIEEVRGWADKVFKSAEAHGVRWQRSVASRIARALAGEKDFNSLAIEYARKLERLVDEGDEVAVQMEVLETVVDVMTKAGKADGAKDLQSRLARLEEKDLADHARKAPFKPDPFQGRRGKSDRAVLVELFTGAECPPCVAADTAFDALEKTYKSSEVILLQYHVHIPGPDPLTNNDTMSRLQYYARKLEGDPSTPTILFNGKVGSVSGGALAAARKKYTEFRDIIEPLLEKDAGAKVELSATRKAGEIAIKATVAEVARTGESVRLRFVLVEDHVRYQGGNGLRYHHCVVRAMPGGAKGFALTKKPTEQTASIKLDELRSKLNEYLDDVAARLEDGFPKPDRPMQLKDLRVVALVQDDDTNEVLQAVQVPVKE